MIQQERQKPDFSMIGSRQGWPTIQDMIALATHLTGKTPTADEVAEAKQILAQAGYPAD